MNKQRNGEIEFWRFVFAVIVVLHHAVYLIPNSPFRFGSFSVEFFYILSGYLMMSSATKKELLPPTKSLGRETAHFLLNKARTIIPEVCISGCIAMLFIFFTAKSSWSGLLSAFLRLWLGDNSLLRTTGIYPGQINSVLWYVSSMLLAMAVLYPLIRKHKDIMCCIVIPLGSVLILGYLMQDNGSFRDPMRWLGLTYRGNLRALAEIGLGTLCYPMAQKLAGLRLNTIGKLAVSGVKWVCYIGVIIWMYLSKGSLDPLALLALMTAIVCTFSAQGIWTKLYNNRLCYALGKISMPLFLCHYYYAGDLDVADLNNILPITMTQAQKLGIYVVCSFVTALVVMMLGDLYKKHRNKIYMTIKRMFLKQIEINENSAEVH